MLNCNSNFQLLKGKALALGCLLSSIVMAQPYEGDLEIYTGSVASGAGNTKPNLLFIADTSGSMVYYSAIEYESIIDSYDPDIDYGDDGAAADDDLIYVYDDIETFSGVTITQSQNKCQALTDVHTNSPAAPFFIDKALQWKPIESQILVSEGVDCPTSTVTPPSSSLDIVGESITSGWETVEFDGTVPDQDDFISGSTITMTVTTSGNRSVRGGLYAYQTNASGVQTGNFVWLCRRNTWNVGQTVVDTCYVDDVPYTNWIPRMWFQRKGSGSASITGYMTYNLDAPPTVTQVDPACVPSDDVYTTAVTDGEWSGSLETSSDADYILECADDAGVHGIDSASADKEAAFCGTASCINPTYVSSSGVDWTSEGLEDKYFYTGNYHDYLNYDPPSPEVDGIPVYDSRSKVYARKRTHHSWSYLGGNLNPVQFCDRFLANDTFWDLTDGYRYFATDSSDSSTHYGPVYDPPTGNQLYVYDSNEDNGFIYVCKQKLDMMHDALTDIVSSVSGVNAGLMRFSSSSGAGGAVTFDIRDIDDYMTPGDSSTATVRSELISEINSLPGSGGTPLVETLYESYLYFRGDSADQGNISITDSDVFSSGSTYDSPIENSCQSNNIIFITDGDPSSDTDRMTAIENVTGTDCYQTSSGAAQTGGYTPANSCLDDLAGVMKNDNIRPDLDGNSHVNTYGIGFNIDLEVMEDMAAAGGGEYYTADSYQDLITAFLEILTEISVSEPSTLVAPAVSVNAFNELRHRNQIYYATFTPAFNPAWEGNVKRYGLAGDGVIFGQAGESAPVISDDGFFKSSAQSFWSDAPDGSTVEAGGFREQLTASRNVYIDGSVLDPATTGIVELTSSSAILPSAFGAADAAEATELRNWLLGIDVDDYNNNSSYLDAHQYAADSLHSRPFVITYSGTSVDDAQDILFLTTNMGEIRAIDARLDQGTELWSYMLPEFMDNVKAYRDNSSAFRHWSAYGLDGEATVYTEEASGSSSSNFNIGTAYMFQGMRRGGKDYFGWDISNADLENASANPISQMWKITGGTGDFTDLGYSWSRMLQATMRWGCTDASDNSGCTTKEVLIFGGGYDGHYDSESSGFNSSDAVDGDAIYIVDMSTGALIWSAGNHNGHDLYQDPQGNALPMYDSIPSDLSPIDIDRDGDMDMLFAIDISGKIFRFDFDQTASGTSSAPGSSYATGGLIANLRDGTNKRRFYNGLDVSFLSPPGEVPYFTLAVGSGYRANPKDEETWANNFYVVIDENLFGPAIDDKGTDSDSDDEVIYQYKTTEDDEGNITSRAVITHSDLYVVTTTGYAKGTHGDYGFYRPFSSTIYEKVLQESATFASEVFVSTYSPVSATSAAGTCGAAEIGSGRVYRFSLETGLSTLDDDGDGVELEVPGIPTEFTWLILDEGLTLCTGTICTSTAKTDPGDTPEDDDDILDWNSLDEAGFAPDGQIGSAIRTYWFEQ